MNNKITPRKFNMPEPLELPLYWYQENPLLTSFLQHFRPYYLMVKSS
ncbi:hypothetical protein [Acinetobacter sp. ANC 3832]|nr:hypothetical protein [Acinetobacter sp. ANC 3832]